jgi:hypothetical protein
MTTEMKTIAAETATIGIAPARTGIVRAPAVTSQTVIADFSKISHLLSNRELRRPRTGWPSAAELKRIAAKNPPPPEWYEGEEECPF